MKRKVCRNCRLFYDDDVCPECKSTDFVQGWKGRITILNAAESTVAKRAGYTKEGEYAIKLGQG